MHTPPPPTHTPSRIPIHAFKEFIAKQKRKDNTLCLREIEVNAYSLVRYRFCSELKLTFLYQKNCLSNISLRRSLLNFHLRIFKLFALLHPIKIHPLLSRRDVPIFAIHGAVYAHDKEACSYSKPEINSGINCPRLFLTRK